jgi:hypothetical protein
VGVAGAITGPDFGEVGRNTPQMQRLRWSCAVGPAPCQVANREKRRGKTRTTELGCLYFLSPSETRWLENPMQNLASRRPRPAPTTRLSGIDSNIRAYVARRLEKYGGGIGQVVEVSRELIGLTYQLSRVVIRISAFVAFPKSSGGEQLLS